MAHREPDREKAIVHCPNCGDFVSVKRFHRIAILERILILCGRFRYRCGECDHIFVLQTMDGKLDRPRSE